MAAIAQIEGAYEIYQKVFGVIVPEAYLEDEQGDPYWEPIAENAIEAYSSGIDINNFKETTYNYVYYVGKEPYLL